ncbi:dihydrofolate reductase [Falsibacillus pallidus]|uniref:Dihydrofolate reductase n=1 Tax=Falsibacillus pallidus TaxID=493781 RepID=A0A370GH06_9BACI|nr:dihydrofolate reductase [Falsibacillus pallidus]RDI43072.1 dihydrofolate reductase [Falsibacillus pallidus]
MISFIFAMDQEGLIGSDNSLPWRLPEDLKFFKTTTMHHPIVMGRKTYESIGKPLPGRTNIILTRDAAYKKGDYMLFHEKESLLNWIDNQDKEVFITGGAELFRLFIDEVDQMYVTKIEETFQGDTYFRDVIWDEWNLVWSTKGVKNEKNPYDYQFMKYRKK